MFHRSASIDSNSCGRKVLALLVKTAKKQNWIRHSKRDWLNTFPLPSSRHCLHDAQKLLTPKKTYSHHTSVLTTHTFRTKCKQLYTTLSCPVKCTARNTLLLVSKTKKAKKWLSTSSLSLRHFPLGNRPHFHAPQSRMAKSI